MYIEGEVWQEPLQEKQGYTVLKMYTILIQQYDYKACRVQNDNSTAKTLG